ncbi:MAG: hypothetical protein ABI685_13610 [Ferruginibacter sp.]
MKINSTIQLKAAFLMIVFSLNTIIGFSCAVGIDMGFNTKHHQEEEGVETMAYTHTTGKSHHAVTAHQEKTGGEHNSNGRKDNCCNDEVLKFSQLDKSVPGTLHIAFPIFFTAFISSFYNIDLSFSSVKNVDIRPFAQSHHPPIPDIRIAIQSFQI